MNHRNIAIVYRKELREALRDRRTLISSLLVPLLLFPVLTAGLGAVLTELVGKARSDIFSIMIIGGADSPDVLTHLRDSKKLRILPVKPDWQRQIINKDIRAAVEIPPSFQDDVAHQKPAIIWIHNYEGNMKSGFATENIQKSLRAYSDRIVHNNLAAQHVADTALKPFEVEEHNVASAEMVGAAAFGGVISYMVILLCLIGSMYPAMDLTAGEKERGTMETILSSPISRVDLVLGKFLLVFTAALVTAALSVVSMGISFGVLEHFHAFDKAGSEAAQFQLRIHFTTVLSIFIMVLPLAVLFAASLMTISLFAKSYKEAQSYISPLMFIVIVPAVAAMLPIDLDAKLSFIPILNASLLCKELVTGTYHWSFIAIIFVSTCVYAAIALFLAVKMFQREDVLFRS